MFFFIFGYGPRRRDLGPGVERDCPNCHNRRRWLRYEETNWISLFFLPVIPTGRKRLTVCPICNYGEREWNG